MNAKELLFFLGGAAVGVGLSFIFIKGKYESESKEAIEEVKSYYKELSEKKKDEETVTIKAEDVGAESENTPSYKTDTVYITDFHTPYDRVIEETRDILENDLEEDEDEEDDGLYAGIHPEEPQSAPYVISDAMFAGDKTYYDKIGLFYYEQDDVIVNENYEVVDNWQALIGPDIGARFKYADKGEDPTEFIYIRNDSLGSDYEIELMHEKFY